MKLKKIEKKETIDFLNDKLGQTLFYFDVSKFDILVIPGKAVRAVRLNSKLNDDGTYFMGIPFQDQNSEHFTKIINFRNNLGNYLVDENTIQLLSACGDNIYITTDFYKLKKLMQARMNMLKQYIYDNYEGQGYFQDIIKSLKDLFKTIKKQIDEARIFAE